MRIALAQITSEAGNIQDNISKHINFIQVAIEEKCDAVFFPELSITNYEPSLAETLQVDADTPVFAVFQDMSDKYDITIGIGAPTKASDGEKPCISMIIFRKDCRRSIYSKQILHDDELVHFSSGRSQIVVQINDCIVAPAICYESRQLRHANKCIDLGASLYLASVAKSRKGLDNAKLNYEEISSRIPVLMVNGIGPMDDFYANGCSSVWKDGKLLYQASNSQGCVVYDTSNDSVTFKSYRQ